MTYVDRTMTCVDCGVEFIHSAADQARRPAAAATTATEKKTKKKNCHCVVRFSFPISYLVLSPCFSMWVLK